METENLFEEVLIKPGTDFQELFIVVGYATPTFLRKHLTDLKKSYKTNKHKINLIIGMDKKSAHLYCYTGKVDNLSGSLFKSSLVFYAE